MLEVGIITSPRDVSYIGQSLDSYFSQWNIKPHVFHEPSCPNYLNHSKVNSHYNQERKGCVLNWYESAKWMLENTNSPFIMMCEDDILWMDDSSKSVNILLKILLGDIGNGAWNIPLSKIGFISPYCARPNAPKKETGWRPASYRSAGWCGALSLIFPRASLTKIIGDRERFIYYASDSGTCLRRNTKKLTGPIFLDYCIGHITFHCEKLTILTHAPTLVQHLGEVSTFAVNNLERSKESWSRQPFLG